MQFIEAAAGVFDPLVPKSIDLQSQSTEVVCYRVNNNGQPVVFVETPGFDSAEVDDIENLRKIYAWMKQ